MFLFHMFWVLAAGRSAFLLNVFPISSGFLVMFGAQVLFFGLYFVVMATDHPKPVAAVAKDAIKKVS
jgi:hypothetical protein